MVLWVFRALFVLASAGTAYGIGLDIGEPFVALLVGIIVSVGVIVAEGFLSRGPIALISSIVFGAMLGMLFATLTVSVLGLAIETETMAAIREELTGALIVVFSFLGIAFIYQSRDKFNLIVPYVEFRREEKGVRPIIVDTNVIIDGRLKDILSTGVIDAPIIIPQIVLHELHLISDSAARLKRERGRLGLEILNELQQMPGLDVRVQEHDIDHDRPVDEQVVRITKMLSGRLMTNDFNLNRLASFEGISVINLNELANAVKSVAVPDDMLSVKLIKAGEQPGQGVGYLPDGTIVIVEQADQLIGEEVDVLVRNVLTRPTGRMIFGRVAGEPPPS